MDVVLGMYKEHVRVSFFFRDGVSVSPLHRLSTNGTLIPALMDDDDDDDDVRGGSGGG
jgi:hypothetical protein